MAGRSFNVAKMAGTAIKFQRQVASSTTQQKDATIEHHTSTNSSHTIQKGRRQYND